MATPTSGSISARGASAGTHIVRNQSDSASRGSERPQSAPTGLTPHKEDQSAALKHEAAERARLQGQMEHIGIPHEEAEEAFEGPLTMPANEEAAAPAAATAASAGGVDPAIQYARDYLRYQLTLIMQTALVHEDPAKREKAATFPGDSSSLFEIHRGTVERHIMQIYTDHETKDASPYRRLSEEVEERMQRTEERIRGTLQLSFDHMYRHVYEGAVELAPPERPAIPEGVNTADIAKSMDAILGDLLPKGISLSSSPSRWGIMQPPMKFGP